MLPSNAELQAARLRMDPVADAVVARIVEDYGPDRAKELFNLLIRNIEIPFDQVPAYVRAYMEGNADFPEWADPDKLKRAQQIFVDRGVAIVVLLYFKALPTCYLYGTAAEVLTLTGRLSGREWPETYARRIAETLQFLLDVLRKDGLRPGGISIATILKVRLMHASVRYFTRRAPEWQADWHPPINQNALLMTLMTFGQTMVEGLAQMGQPLSKEDGEAFFHAWRVTGHFLGIEAQLNPEHLDEGNALMARLLAMNASASQAGKECTAALIAFSKDFLVGKVFDRTPEMFILRFMGKEFTAMLGVNTGQGCVAAALPQVFLDLLRLQEKIEDRWPTFALGTNALGMALLKGLRQKYRSYKGRGIELPADLMQAWGVE